MQLINLEIVYSLLTVVLILAFFKKGFVFYSYKNVSVPIGKNKYESVNTKRLVLLNITVFDNCVNVNSI